MTTIKTKVQKEQDKIQKAQSKIRELQQACTHNGLRGKYGANTGNWCSGDDSYWIDFECPECGKRWREDKDEQQYFRDVNKTKEGFIWEKSR